MKRLASAACARGARRNVEALPTWVSSVRPESGRGQRRWSPMSSSTTERAAGITRSPRRRGVLCDVTNRRTGSCQGGTPKQHPKLGKKLKLSSTASPTSWVSADHFLLDTEQTMCETLLLRPSSVVVDQNSKQCIEVVETPGTAAMNRMYPIETPPESAAQVARRRGTIYGKTLPRSPEQTVPVESSTDRSVSKLLHSAKADSACSAAQEATFADSPAGSET